MASVEKKHDEFQYLDLIQDVLANGHDRRGRTEVTTKAVFGRMCRYDLSNFTLPLLTTKRVSFHHVWAELLFFLQGRTQTKWLEERKVNIWRANTCREKLDELGFTDYDEGEMGPSYGYQWRKAGGDQLTSVIEGLKENPYERRHVVSAWNPADIPKMVLAPCHSTFQFFVDDKGLSCSMYQRSADIGLGVAFNQASYGLLTHIVAEICGYKAHEFIHVMGDAHIYKDHEEPLQEQLKRQPFPFPTIAFTRSLKDVSLDDLQLEDVKLMNYVSHPSIAMKMSA